VVRCVLSLALAFVVSCGGPSTLSPASGPTSSSATPTAAVTPTAAAAATAAGAPVLRIALTDVRTGERFTLGGFAGKTVIVEGMAVW
jgi:hypothetical protein